MFSLEQSALETSSDVLDQFTVGGIVCHVLFVNNKAPIQPYSDHKIAQSDLISSQLNSSDLTSLIFVSF